MYEIGRLYGCSFSTVKNRMREYGIESVSRSIIQSTYKKKNFSEDKKEKAYILGFRLGDLNVYKTKPHSKVVVVRCNTTCIDQIRVMQSMFAKYGKVSYKEQNSGTYSVNCFLNDTFDFLLPKKDYIPKWIRKNSEYSACFASGYIDAEGNVGVYDGRARLKVDSYDKNTIFWLYEWFNFSGAECPHPLLIGKKGQLYNRDKGYKYNGDLWRVRVSKKESLLKLFALINPYLRHTKRRKDVKKCLKNIYDRNQSHT